MTTVQENDISLPPTDGDIFEQDDMVEDPNVDFTRANDDAYMFGPS